MKKILLAVGLIGTLAAPGKGWAQTAFTTPSDTVKGTYSTGLGEYHNNITAGSSDITVTWNVIDDDFPASWATAAALGICDNVLCRSNLNNQLTDGTQYTTNNIPAGTTADFHLQMDLNGAVNGTHSIAVRLRSGSTTKNVVWTVSKGVTGVVNISKNEGDVVVYPNPARGSVNVVFNDDADVKNVAIFNLIGKMVSIYRVNGSSANIPLNDVPAGIYFMRLLDSQGRIVATRKFTHQ